MVDDEQDIIFIFRKALQSSGFEVYGFTDPVLALEHFKTNAKHYALVISDIRMPQMTGFELAKRIRQIKPEVKVLLMTAFELTDFESSGILPSLKVDDFLQKPISPDYLRNVAQKHLAKRKN